MKTGRQRVVKRSGKRRKEGRDDTRRKERDLTNMMKTAKRKNRSEGTRTVNGVR